MLINRSCRRRDQSKSLSYSSTSTDQSPPLTPLQSFSFDEVPVRDIVPQRSPTSITYSRFSYSEPSEDGLEFSEHEKRRRPRMNVQDSEAARYLRSFHSTESQAELLSRTPRPRYNRSSTSIAGLSAAPSLSDSPTSTDAMSMPYTPFNRPLPTRYNPFSSSYGTKTVDLVNPFAIVQPAMPTTAPSSLMHAYSFKSPAVTSGSTDLAEGDVTYEKRGSISSSSPDHGSLKQLFRFSEMQAPPSYNEA